MNDYEKVIRGIRPMQIQVQAEAQKALDGLIKPIGSLGRLEAIAAQIAGITGQVKNSIHKKCIVVMCADNGIWEEGVSACPQEVTQIQSVNFTKGICGINVLSRCAGADLSVVDIGINSDSHCEGIMDRKIRKGTRNIAKEAAMTKEEAIRAIETGIEMVAQLIKEGYDLLGTGEMGICNTSTSSAMLMAFTGCCADEAVGKGAGLTLDAYMNKKAVIKKALQINQPNPSDAIDVVSKVGGLDIAGMIGCFLGAAFYRVPIVIDGFISAVAALAAYRIHPHVKDYMIPSHCSEEPGYLLVMKALGMAPILNLGMRLGEGTGCALMFPIIEASLAISNQMATFEEGSITNDFMVDIRKEG